jgi:hypothetical protein
MTRKTTAFDRLLWSSSDSLKVKKSAAEEPGYGILCGSWRIIESDVKGCLFRQSRVAFVDQRRPGKIMAGRLYASWNMALWNRCT